MNAQVIQLAPIRVVMLQHLGPYDQIGPVFDQLWAWVNTHGVPAQRLIGIYWDNPRLCSRLAITVSSMCRDPPYFELSDRGTLPLSVEQIAGGTYVTTRFVGPYENLAPVWTALTQYTEGPLRLRVSGNPAFEVYVNDPSNTPPDQLITELYMPVN